MQMVVNELSVKFPDNSIQEAKTMMEGFINTYFKVKNIIKNDAILLEQNYGSFLLAPQYRIENWRNDTEVDIEVKRQFRSMLNRSEIYSEKDFLSEHEELLCLEFQCEEKTSLGCLIAYQLEGVAISFLSDTCWEKEEIKGILKNMNKQGNILEQEVSVRNVSHPENIDSFSSYYQNFLLHHNRQTFQSGNDILDCKEDVFPNLIFCDNAIRQLREDIGATEVSQVYKKLTELQRAAEEMTGVFQPQKIVHATPESPETLKRYAEEHTFRLPDGSREKFSWHIRFTGSYGGRIFFLFIPEKQCICIGHIGKKLPTVKYN